jgi:multiple antibiotic resistance protein
MPAKYQFRRYHVDTSSFLTMIVGLFAITGSIAIIPIFIGATDGQTNPQRRKTALIATATYVVAGLIALFVGNAALNLFGISVAALRVAGMAIVAVIGWKMLNAATPTPADNANADGPASKTVHHHVASNTKIVRTATRRVVPSPMEVGIMPLGFPIYGGPGVMSVIIAWGSGAKPVYFAAIVAIVVNAAIIIALDFLATPITNLIGAEGLLVTEKVFGLIVVALAISGMAGALLTLFPGLAGAH